MMKDGLIPKFDLIFKSFLVREYKNDFVTEDRELKNRMIRRLKIKIPRKIIKTITENISIDSLKMKSLLQIIM